MLSLKKYKKLILNFIAIFLLIINLILEYQFQFKRDAIALTVIYYIAIFFAWEDVLCKLFKSITAKNIFSEYLMMSIAIVAALIIKEYLEAIMVLVFYNIGVILQNYAIKKAEKKINKFVEDKRTVYNVYKNNQLVQKQNFEIEKGDVISIAPGEVVPVDSVVEEGKGLINVSSYTGEEIPREVKKGDFVFAGTINLNSNILLSATTDLSNSKITEINDIINMAVGRKSSKEKFVDKFAKYYTPIILISVICMLILSYILGGREEFNIWLKKALLFLVASCPCALVISIPLAYFAGIGKAASKNIIFKGANYLDKLSYIKVIAFDKTGTLTDGEINILEVVTNGIKEELLKEYLLAAEINSHHPIAESVKKQFKDISINFNEIESMREDGGLGVQVEYKGHLVKVGKADYLGIILEDDFSMIDGSNRIYVSVDGIYVGNIKIGNRVQKGAKKVIEYLEKNKYEIMILTGDQDNSASKVSYELGLKNYKANLTPIDKAEEIKKIQGDGRRVVYVGDGINDGPALASSDVGVAIGGEYNSAAIKTADIILLSSEITKLLEAFEISKKTKKVAIENITISIIIKLLVLMFAFFFDVNMVVAVFADVGVTLLAIMNSLRVVLSKKENRFIR